jgi:hypothetical protein
MNSQLINQLKLGAGNTAGLCDSMQRGMMTSNKFYFNDNRLTACCRCATCNCLLALPMASSAEVVLHACCRT